MILIIDNYDSFTYNLFQSVAQFYPNVRVVRNDRISLSQVKELQPKGIILSPGPGRPEQAGICIDLIRSIDEHIPLLGVCLGHQAIGAAFGCRIIQAPQIVHGKSERIFHYRRGNYQHLPLPMIAGRYHSLMIDRSSLPDCLQIESETATGIIMGIRHQTLPIFGVQFHPESILTPQGNALLKNFIGQCQLQSPASSTPSRDLIAGSKNSSCSLPGSV
jgi:anthranilate synthase component 2